MKLYYTPIAHYVHSVEAVINHAGLRDRIEPIPTRPFEASSALPDVNPLGTVPTLVCDDGTPLYGGPVIYEYLDNLHQAEPLYPVAGTARWASLRRAWLADGIFDAFVRLIMEAWEPPASQRAAFVARQWSKIVRGLDALESEAAAFGALEIGQIRAVGAISFIALKMVKTAEACPLLDAAFDWREGRPALSRWFDRVSADPIFTRPMIP